MQDILILKKDVTMSMLESVFYFSKYQYIDHFLQVKKAI